MSSAYSHQICYFRFTAFKEYQNVQVPEYGSYIHQDIYVSSAVLPLPSHITGVEKPSRNIEEVRETGRAVRLGGDGRADTPGHCAMFGSYTLMNLEENKVVQLVEVFIFSCDIRICHIIYCFSSNLITK